MSDQRLIAVFGQLGKIRSNDAEALAALRHVDRMIADRGLDWTRIAQIVVEAIPSAGVEQKDDARRASSADTQSTDAPFQGQPFTSTRYRYHLDGIDIPARIAGICTIDADDGETMMVTVDDAPSDMRYGPIIAVGEEMRNAVLRAASSSRWVTAEIRVPDDDDEMPVIIRIV